MDYFSLCVECVLDGLSLLVWIDCVGLAFSKKIGYFEINRLGFSGMKLLYGGVISLLTPPSILARYRFSYPSSIFLCKSHLPSFPQNLQKYLSFLCFLRLGGNHHHEGLLTPVFGDPF